MKYHSPTILYEDDDIIALDKPSGLLSMATPNEREETLYHYVLEYLHRSYDFSKVFIVHRLDRDTSGVMVFAKNYQTKEELQELFEEGKIYRHYQAVLSSIPNIMEGTLVNYLHIDRMGNVFVSDSHDRYAEKAITEYKVVKTVNGFADTEINILTGKKNQIRIAFSEIGCPIVGDRKFGDANGKRLCLNASELDLRAYRNDRAYLIKSKISIFK